MKYLIFYVFLRPFGQRIPIILFKRAGGAVCGSVLYGREDCCECVKHIVGREMTTEYGTINTYEQQISVNRRKEVVFIR